MKKAIDICPGNKILLCLDENPLFLMTQTSGINISCVTIRSNGEWRPNQFCIEIDVPKTKDFIVNVKRYTISLICNILY